MQKQLIVELTIIDNLDWSKEGKGRRNTRMREIIEQRNYIVNKRWMFKHYTIKIVKIRFFM